MRKYLLLTLLLTISSTIVLSQNNRTRIKYITDSKTVYDIAYTPKGELVGLTDLRSVKIFRTNTGELIHEFGDEHHDLVLSLDISKDSSLLVSAGKDGLVVLYDLASRKVLNELRYHSVPVLSVKISPDCKYIASADATGKVVVYSISQNAITATFTDHQGEASSVAFSPDGKMLATAGADKTIKIYNLEKMTKVLELHGHKDWVRDIRFGSNSQKLASCGDDGNIITWKIDLSTSKCDIFDKSSESMSWMLTTDFLSDPGIYVCGGISNNVRIVTPFVKYKQKIGSPILKIRLIPNNDSLLIMVVASLGKGAFLMDASNMEIVE